MMKNINVEFKGQIDLALKSINYKEINYPIKRIDFKDAFEQLTDEEKLYAYYLTQACWAGSPILLFQVSFESPPLFYIFQNFFSSFKPFNTMKSTILLESDKGITDIDFKQFLRYAAKFYSNFGNYHIFKKTKFKPELAVDKFEKILSVSKNFKDIQFIWDNIKVSIYDDRPNFNKIDLDEKTGKNSYYLYGITKENINKIDNELKLQKKNIINTRLMSANQNKFAVLVGSIEEKQVPLNEEINLVYGEFSSFLKRINAHLEVAKKYTQNESETELINSYIKMFNTGELDDYLNSHKLWFNNRSPNVEFNFGWIDTLIDPLGVRGAYQGWIAIKDKDYSSKCESFISNASKLFSSLPWKEDFNNAHANITNESFNSNNSTINSTINTLNADKTSMNSEYLALDLISFSSNSLPIGINKESNRQIGEILKILYFKNSYFNYQTKEYAFCQENDVEILKEYGKTINKIKISLECLNNIFKPKLLYKGEETYDKLINPLTDEKVQKFYMANETFESKFGELHHLLVQIRKDCLSLYLIYNKKLQEFLGVEEKVSDTIIYVFWLTFVRKAILFLPLYNAENKAWEQAKIQSAWLITNFILSQQTQGQELINITLESNENIKIELKREMILCIGQVLIEQILLKIQIWICTGDVESATEFINKYSTLNEKYLEIKKKVESNEVPQTLVIYNNLKIEEVAEKDNIIGRVVKIVEYPETFEGIIESFVDRFGTDFNKDIYDQWIKNDVNFYS